ncbi:hypothetical protein BH20ACT17_BH20ACT17_13790 [soil metagenome]
MSVISRSALQSSSLADLHDIASELGLDGYRRLRKSDLALAIIERQGGDVDAPADADDAADANGAAAIDKADDAVAAEQGDDAVADKPARRSRRGGRGRSLSCDRDTD